MMTFFTKLRKKLSPRPQREKHGVCLTVGGKGLAFGLFMGGLMMFSLAATIPGGLPSAKVTTGWILTPEAERMPALYLPGKIWVGRNLSVEVDGSWCYNDDPENCARFGRLYTWKAAAEACRSLGEGWRLPTDWDWREMTRLFGGIKKDAKDQGGQDAYRALVEGGNSGIDLMLGGFRSEKGEFLNLQEDGYYWTSTAPQPESVLRLVFYNYLEAIYIDETPREMGYSCRCVKDR